MAFYQIADSYVQRVPGSKSAHKADQHDEELDNNGYNTAIRAAITQTYAELANAAPEPV